MKHTTEEITEKLKQIYGDKYDYSKVEYRSLQTKICVICKEHGEFWQMPQTMLKGYGCPVCAAENRRKKDEEGFLQRSKEKHGDKYDYSKVVYIDAKTPVEIVCQKHGSFWQTPNIHSVCGCGCPQCARERNRQATIVGKEEFVKRAKEVWGDSNDYTNTVYERYDKPLEVFCNIHHQPYMVHPYRHVHLGVGCPICSQEKFHEKKTLTQEEFIARCREVHGDEYDYSKTVYTGNRNDVTITCKEHGDFIQNAANHIKGYGCPMCRYVKLSEKKKKSQEQFIADARKVHGDYYDYSRVEYHGCFTKVKIICPRHGLFEQTPATHLKGSGCPICRKSKGEERISAWLKENNIKHDAQYKIPNESILCKNKYFVVDFYLPNHNTIIEYNGQQHYEPVYLWGGEEKLESQKERDNALRQYCKEHKTKLIEIPFSRFDDIELILSKKLKIKNKNYG